MPIATHTIARLLAVAERKGSRTYADDSPKSAANAMEQIMTASDARENGGRLTWRSSSAMASTHKSPPIIIMLKSFPSSRTAQYAINTTITDTAVIGITRLVPIMKHRKPSYICKRTLS
jgi:hypothetical protein